MRAVVLRRPMELEMVDVPRPKPREDEVIIQVRAVGICGSDVRYYLGENPWSLHTLGKDLKETKSFILGHEVSGDIIEEGTRVGRHRISERVGAIAFRGCGECYYCRNDLPNLCEDTLHIGHDGRWRDIEYPPGGYAEYMQIWADKAHPIPDNVSYEEATQLDGLAVAVHANGRAAVSPADVVAVIGSGAIGLMSLQVAKARGAVQTVAVDTWEVPLEIARDLGADHVVNARNAGDIAESILSITGGLGANVVFDTVGSEKTVKAGLRALSRGGRFVLLAVTPTKVDLQLTDIAGERSLTSSANNLYREYAVGVALLAKGDVRVKPFITHVMKLEEYREAFDMLLKKEEHRAIKIVLKP